MKKGLTFIILLICISQVELIRAQITNEIYFQSKEKLWGIKDGKTGAIIIEPKYVALFMPCDGARVAVNSELKYGVIGLKGEAVHPFRYDFILNKTDGVHISGLANTTLKKEISKENRRLKKKFSKFYNPYEKWIDSVRLGLYWKNKNSYSLNVLDEHNIYNRFIEEDIKMKIDNKGKEVITDKQDDESKVDSLEVDLIYDQKNNKLTAKYFDSKNKKFKNSYIPVFEKPYPYETKKGNLLHPRETIYWTGDSLFSVKRAGEPNLVFKKNNQGRFYLLNFSQFRGVTLYDNELYSAVLNVLGKRRFFNIEGKIVYNKQDDESLYDSIQVIFYDRNNNKILGSNPPVFESGYLNDEESRREHRRPFLNRDVEAIEWIGDSVFVMKSISKVFKKNKEGKFSLLTLNEKVHFEYFGNGLFKGKINYMYVFCNLEGEIIFDNVADYSYDENGVLIAIKQETAINFPIIPKKAKNPSEINEPRIDIRSNYPDYSRLERFTRGKSRAVVYHSGSKKIKSKAYHDISHVEDETYIFTKSDRLDIRGVAVCDSNKVINEHDVRFLKLRKIIDSDFFIGMLEDSSYVKYNYKTRDTITFSNWTTTWSLGDKKILDKKYLTPLKSDYIEGIDEVRDLATGKRILSGFVDGLGYYRDDVLYYYMEDGLFIRVTQNNLIEREFPEKDRFRVQLYDAKKRSYVNDFYCGNFTKTEANGIYKVYRVKNNDASKMYIGYVNRYGEYVYPMTLNRDFKYEKPLFFRHKPRGSGDEHGLSNFLNSTSSFGSSFGGFFR